jgi:hypothetical protein
MRKALTATSWEGSMFYLKAYSAGSIIATSWRLYLREWRTIFLIYILPLLAAHILNTLIKHTGPPGVIIAALGSFIASTFVVFPTTVAISEICLDMKPTLARSYRRAFAQPGKLIGTYLMSLAIVVAGFLLLFVPGMVFSVWYMLVGPVVVLEALAGKAALKRSRELGRGYYWRNLWTIFAGTMLAIIVILVVTFAIGLVLAYFNLIGEPWAAAFGDFIGGVLGLIGAPPISIMPVLIYYDMRARKEGYAASQLADDLRF